MSVESQFRECFSKYSNRDKFNEEKLEMSAKGANNCMHVYMEVKNWNDVYKERHIKLTFHSTVMGVTSPETYCKVSRAT